MRDIAKLPKWAQQEIERLQSNVAYWKGKATAGPDNSDTFVNRYGEGDTPLGAEPHIKFVFGEHWSETIEARKQGGEVVVSSGDLIVVQPWAANTVKIRQVRR